MLNVIQELDKVTTIPIVRYRGHILPELYVSILALIGEGMGNPEIANELDFSSRTIEGLIAKIRELVFSITGERLTERKLVIFGREMLDGYQAFLRLRDRDKHHRPWNNYIELIEDWDDIEDDEDLPGLDAGIELPPQNRPHDKIVDLRQYRHDYEITNFEAEERELIYSNGTHYLV